MLKLGFIPVGACDRIWAEKCYSIDEETDAVVSPERERTYQHFLRMTDADGGNGLGIVSHGTHGYHQQDDTLWLSVLRSPAYACMNVAPDWHRYRGRFIPHHEQGGRSARFSFVFGAESLDSARMARTACELNVGLEQMIYYPTRRTTETVQSVPFLTADCDNVILGALKKAEDGDALVMRCWETAGRDTRFTLTVDGRQFPVSIGAYRLQTFRLERSSGMLLTTDLLERPQQRPHP
jgi:alpha-mannosidase